LRETLQRFVPPAKLLTALDSIEVEEGEDRLAGIGVVPVSWMASRTLGTIEVAPCNTVDILATGALDVLCEEREQRYMLSDLLGPATKITQQISRSIYNRPENFAGIYAVSKHGANVRNYSFFEEDGTSVLRARARKVDAKALTPDLPVLFDVVNALRLRFEGVELEAADWAELEWGERFATLAANALLAPETSTTHVADKSVWLVRSPAGLITAHTGRDVRSIIVLAVRAQDSRVSLQEYSARDDVRVAVDAAVKALQADDGEALERKLSTLIYSHGLDLGR
jgi:hypothetical protein